MATNKNNRLQIERRRAGDRVRVEVTFNVTGNDQHYELVRYLSRLPKGTASDFIRAAIAEKIQRETMPQTAQQGQQAQVAVDLMATLAQDLAALQARVEASEATTRALVRATEKPGTAGQDRGFDALGRLGQLRATLQGAGD